jgi:myosin heavy subunit
MDTYKSIIKSKTPYDDKKKFAPHIWTLTALAYRQMLELKTKQAIVISGESGSGKTENAKRAMKFLTSLGAHHNHKHNADEVPIEQKILDTNPVLESFGNAKTVRNNNSSRFGKYVLLYFTQKNGEILGARVKNYLLEKSRVIGPAKNERNYHVFYHLLRGSSDQLCADLGLLDPASKKRFDFPDFNYLKNGGDVD